MKKTYLGLSASMLALSAGAAFAQAPVKEAVSTAPVAAAPPPGDELSEVIVTGTRTTGLKAADSAAPIQVLDAGTLSRTGQPDLIQALSQNVPSFTAQSIGGDTANLTLSAKLRGLSPNDTLVLVNGKRRHGTANLAVLGGPYQGGAAPDLNFIPANSIDHVEVLTDGAAAQYGTDAIAGVVNFITKKAKQGGNIQLSAGTYYNEGGDTPDASINFGLEPLGDKSWLNLTYESKFHGHSNRGAIDPRLYNHPNATGGTTNNVGAGGPNVNALAFPAYPYSNQISGDAMYHLNVLSFDAGYDFGDGFTAYSFGSYGHKNGQAFENYRVPTVAPTVYPLGFSPKEEIQEDDFSFTAGIKGKLFGWNADLSTTYGRDLDTFYTENTINPNISNPTAATYNGSRQNLFFDGKLTAGQWTTNFDVSKEFPVGMATPLNVALGVEYRQDTYQISPGELYSYSLGGAQSYPGFSNIVATKQDRDDVGLYADFAVSPVTAWKLDGAVRFEHFSDFGDTTVGKITSRYDFSPEWAVRGTISTGFRAPTLAEEYYASVNVGPTSAVGQFPPNSPGVAALGFSKLKPETSNNYSAGLVFHPIPKFTGTIDAYYIQLSDRIAGSGTINGSNHSPTVLVSPAVVTALNNSGYTFSTGVTDTGIALFANGLDTDTYGLEWVFTYNQNLGDMGRLDYSFSGNYGKTHITKIAASPAQIAPQKLYDATALSIIEDTTPDYKMILGVLWSWKKLTVNARETFYGGASQMSQDYTGVYQKITIDATPITDLEVSYAYTPAVRFTLGANNLFNQYPDKLPASYLNTYIQGNSNGGVTQYPGFSSFGINGGYYYGKITYSF